MVKHRYDDPNCFVLRLLQSAAMVGGRDAEVIVGSVYRKAGVLRVAVAVRFFVDEPGRYGELPSLLKALTKPEQPLNADGYLAAGMQAVMPLMEDGFQFMHLRGEKRETLTWTAQGCQVQRQFSAHASNLQSEFRLSQRLPQPEKKSFLRRFWDLLGSPTPLIDIASLLPRLITLPLEFRLGAAHIRTPNVQRLGSSEAPRVMQLAPKKIFDVGFWVRGQTNESIVLDLEGCVTRYDSKTEFLRCSLYAQLSAEKSCRFHWVEAGVVVETEEVPVTEFAFEAWVTTTGLQSDLSGFKVVKNDAHRKKVVEVQELAGLHLGDKAQEWLAQQDSGYRDTDIM